MFYNELSLLGPGGDDYDIVEMLSYFDVKRYNNLMLLLSLNVFVKGRYHQIFFWVILTQYICYEQHA